MENVVARHSGNSACPIQSGKAMVHMADPHGCHIRWRNSAPIKEGDTVKISASIRWRTFLFLVCLLCAGGCATAKQITGPSGETIYSIDCSGIYANIGTCLEKAGSLCGGAGYELLVANGANLGSTISPSPYGYFSSPVIQREIIIRCKKKSSQTEQASDTSHKDSHDDLIQ